MHNSGEEKNIISSDKGKVTISGGTFSSTSTYGVISNWGSGTFKSALSGIYLCDSSKVVIKGGTFKHAKVSSVKAVSTTFLYNDGGTLTISGGTFTNSKADSALLINLGKATISGSASLKDSGKTRDTVINEGGTLTIKGGTITKTGAKNVPLSVSGGTVKMTGGTIKATNEMA
ncbi:MAG: hypothetical protein LUG93_02175 [Lachnospiraceae bacterium]|nr:hypothetical protein [Lachnospiraceae bacterium]